MPNSIHSRNSVDAHSDAGSVGSVAPNVVMRCALRGSVESFGALFESEEHDRDALLAMLVERDSDNKSPLDMAAILDHVDLMKELIAKGADSNAATGTGC